jgi:LysR family nitrogen assimilation transcriptional regulator
MDLKALRYFVAISDAGSLSAASQVVSVAQPALSRQLRELEKDLGTQLLLRSSRGVHLTPAGATLYEAAQRILNEATRVRQKLTGGSVKMETAINLGASPTLARVLLPGLFARCQKSNASIQLRIREAYTPVLLRHVERGLVDMAVVTDSEAGQPLSIHPLLGEPFALVAHVSRRLRPVISIGQLSRIPILITSLHRRIIERQLAPLGGHLNVHAEIDSVDSIRELVLHGRWATLMPVSVFKETQASHAVTLSEISGVQLNRLLVLATRPTNNQSPAIAIVSDMVQTEFARLSRQGMFSFSLSTPVRVRRELA